MFSTIAYAPALAALDRAIEGERPAHAYVFAGPEGVGKAEAALEFAAALNCTAERTQRPCRVCRSCRDTFATAHPDVELVAPGGLCDESDHKDHADSRDLRICQIRRLERVLSLAPYGGGHRVAIIDAADSLHAESANAFLKTLEEPPEGTVIILLVEREERLPETVMSRCQRISFRRLPIETVVQTLLTRGADEKTARAIAAIAGGRVGWALRALADPAILEERSSTLDEAVRIAHAGRVERFAWAKGPEGRQEARERYARILDLWETWWRDVLAASAGSSDGFVNRDRSDVLREEGRLYATDEIVRLLRAIAATREHLLANVDPQLALESLTLDLPQPARAAAVRR